MIYEREVFVMRKLTDYIKDNYNPEKFIKENKDLLIKVAVTAFVVIAAFFVFVMKSDNDPGEEVIETEPLNNITEEASAVIYVDIGGEVNNPMLAQLKDGSRVDDAIKAAGGTTENADLTDINRAAFVEDGEKIYIPAKSEFEELADGNYTQVYSDGKININTADAVELQELDGVGPATADKIIEYREQNGRFSSAEDIKNVSGIGEKTFEKMKDDIKV